jgi:hypothetical protein
MSIVSAIVLYGVEMRWESEGERVKFVAVARKKRSANQEHD